MMDIEALTPLATGRRDNLFEKDVTRSEGRIRDSIERRRILVIGAAGSIGAATVKTLAAYGAGTLHAIDLDESSLAELVRDLRSGTVLTRVSDFRALPLDYGAPVMRRFLGEARGYDLILNFAALKHVRSEKDVYSLTQLLDTNVVKQARLLRWLAELGMTGRYFCVSTDKAANPVGLMGASKRLMEHLVFSGAAATGFKMEVSSARFANVAFSAGSVLESFLFRLSKKQPLAVPRDTWRFFVSLHEAAAICLLSSTIAPAGSSLIPRFEQSQARDLLSIATTVLEQHGLKARPYEDEAAAKCSVDSDRARGEYPLLVTPLDTTGEKSSEEFLGPGETTVDIGLEQLMAVPYVPADATELAALLQELESMAAGEAEPSKDRIVSRIGDVLPEFHHRETFRHLDQRA